MNNTGSLNLRLQNLKTLGPSTNAIYVTNGTYRDVKVVTTLLTTDGRRASDLSSTVTR